MTPRTRTRWWRSPGVATAVALVGGAVLVAMPLFSAQSQLSDATLTHVPGAAMQAPAISRGEVHPAFFHELLVYFSARHPSRAEHEVALP